MKAGFSLRELRLSGPGLADATVAFADGLNLVLGPSETGKSYIADCLAFALGAAGSPGDIPQARGYQALRLTLVARADGATHTLERQMDGTGEVEHTVNGVHGDPLSIRNTKSKRRRSLSDLLLELSGLQGRVVRTNVAGAVRPLHFRDVRRLFVIDETTVIEKGSPVLSGQHTDETVDRRVLRALLTGQDDSGVVAVDKPAVARVRRAGRVEVVEQLLSAARAEVDRLAAHGTAEQAAARADEWAAQADSAIEALTSAQEAAAPAEERRRALVEERRRIRSLLAHRTELATRFDLLKAQYESDFDRLSLTVQTSGHLGQLPQVSCPVCGAAAEHQQHEHQQDHVDAEQIAASCRAEAEKIAVLLTDLGATVTENTRVQERLAAEEARQSADIAQVDHILSNLLRPRVAAAAARLRDGETGRRRETETADALRRAAHLQGLLDDAKQADIPVRAEGSTGGVSVAEAQPLMTEVERLLHQWQLPDAGRVSWSESNDDIVVGDRARSSFGKGKRAILRAAFHLALHGVLHEQERSSPGLVVIDSPLVVYREPDMDTDDELPVAVKSRFYESLADGYGDRQVIIMENEEPPEHVAAGVSLTRFTAADHGRRGFIPAPDA
jgi:hypothetical protein